MRLSMKPQTKTYVLGFDPMGEATVTIRQATNGDNTRRFELTEKQQWSRDNDGSALTVIWNPGKIARLDAYLTLVGADLEDEDGNPLFQFQRYKDGSQYLAMSQDAFNKVWDALPSELAAEIHEHILDCNPQWDTSSGE